MTAPQIINEENIFEKIYVIRNIKVMLDRDLAEIYGVKAIRLREQVKRNAARFPKHFMFQLSEDEADLMVSQNAIPSRKHLGGAMPYAFSEHGILMLANILKSDQAILMSIKIIEVFIKIREMILNNKDLLLKLERLETILTDHDDQIQKLFGLLKHLITEKQEPREPMGYKLSGDKDRNQT
ncbi:ORF6N domain-containing protein [Mucilaginibacter sp.]|uniref:ORF6N domain-containing protein n=1 Tax=Mucilaginibacter sp. TaxID=1882438 RepID=UPI003263EF2C